MALDSASALRLDYYRHLAELWDTGNQPPPAQPPFIDYLRQLAKRAKDLQSLVPVAAEDLDLFRTLVMAKPEDLRRRLLGANVLRLRGLERSQRAALRALEVSPDLLSPLGEQRYEPAHSRLLGYFMDRRRVPGLAQHLLREMLALIDAPAEASDDDSISATAVSIEVVISGGRVDIELASPSFLGFIEVKVDAAEGLAQLRRYRKALDARADGRATVLA